uniref:Probable G-protein coupled receptor 151 protein n=1 Tax=Callorhinchus milii TaxID=7868 RepID=A0A4W3J7E7_CALMI
KLAAAFPPQNTQSLHFTLAGGSQYLEDGDFRTSLPVILGVICLLGLSGNVLVAMGLTMDLRKGRRSAVNTWILVLSSTDFLILLLCLPIRAAVYSKPTWTLGRLACKSSDYILQALLTTKAFCLAALGHASYRQVSQPTKPDHLKPQPATAILALSGLTASILLPIPHWLFSTTQQSQLATYCLFQVPSHGTRFMWVFSKAYPVLAYCLPLAFSIVCPIKALLLPGTPQRNRTINPRYQTRRVSIMVLALSLAFALLRLPDWITWIWLRHRDTGSSKPPVSLMVLSQVLLFLGCTVNPVIVSAMSREFRDGLRDIWSAVRCRQAPRSTSEELEGEREGKGPGRRGNSALGHLQTISTLQNVDICQSPIDQLLPDVRHFWQDRENTKAAVDQDPIPWEHHENGRGVGVSNL